MLQFGGVNYAIDLDALDKRITVKTGRIEESNTKVRRDENGKIMETNTETFIRDSEEKTVDMAKYDTLKYFIELLLEPTDGGPDDDDTLGLDRAMDKASLGYKIIFNTLLKDGILTEVESE